MAFAYIIAFFTCVPAQAQQSGQQSPPHFNDAPQYDEGGGFPESCAVWTAARAADLAHIDEQLLVGRIAGYAEFFAEFGNKKVMIDSNLDTIFQYVDNYCKKNLTKTVDDAAWDFTQNSGMLSFQ